MSRTTLQLALLLSGTLALAGCAAFGGAQDDPGVDLADAQVAVRTEKNGDVIEEYRVGGTLKMVKVVPARGPTYYLIDENGDGRLDSSKGEGPVSPVYWKLYGW
jgi:starvation-inducible outer membrane lipoprotein